MDESKLAQKKILIAHESDTIVLMYTQILEKLGVIVIRCLDEQEVFGLLDKHDPDVLLLSASFKEKPGAEICSEIRSNISYTDLPIIMLVRNDDEKSVIDSIDSGASEYLLTQSIPKIIVTKILNTLELLEMKKYISSFDSSVREIIEMLTGRKTNFKEYLFSLKGEDASEFRKAIVSMLGNLREINKCRDGE